MAPCLQVLRVLRLQRLLKVERTSTAMHEDAVISEKIFNLAFAIFNMMFISAGPPWSPPMPSRANGPRHRALGVPQGTGGAIGHWGCQALCLARKLGLGP